ncbi:MAG: FlgD immunoglobulin-like domain containing protein [Candidatus Latescibacterota bacterium]
MRFTGFILLIVLLCPVTGSALSDIEEMKQAYHFSEWPGKDGRLIPRVDLTRENIPALPASKTLSDSFGRFNTWYFNGRYTLSYDFRWSVLRDWDVQVRMAVAGVCVDAHEYLLYRFMSRTDPAMSVRDVPAVAGDISFNKGTYFIRNNIAIELYADGDLHARRAEIARQIDDILLARPTISPESSYRPIVSKIEFTRILYRTRTAKIIPTVHDPLGGAVHTDFTYRNGYDSCSFENNTWYYTLYQPGSSVLMLLFVNESGFNTPVRLNITATEDDIFLTPSAVDDATPNAFTLHQNMPNPFNPSTTISFTLPKPGLANLSVFSITGQKIRTLLSRPMSAGAHSVVWDGRDENGKAVSSGIYIARLRAGKHTANRRMALVR